MTWVRVIPGHPALARSPLRATQTPWADQLPAAAQVFTCPGLIITLTSRVGEVPSSQDLAVGISCFIQTLVWAPAAIPNAAVQATGFIPEISCCDRERRAWFGLQNSESEGHFCMFSFSAGLSWHKFSSGKKKSYYNCFLYINSCIIFLHCSSLVVCWGVLIPAYFSGSDRVPGDSGLGFVPPSGPSMSRPFALSPSTSWWSWTTGPLSQTLSSRLPRMLPRWSSAPSMSTTRWASSRPGAACPGSLALTQSAAPSPWAPAELPVRGDSLELTLGTLLLQGKHLGVCRLGKMWNPTDLRQHLEPSVKAPPSQQMFQWWSTGRCSKRDSSNPKLLWATHFTCEPLFLSCESGNCLFPCSTGVSWSIISAWRIHR